MHQDPIVHAMPVADAANLQQQVQATPVSFQQQGGQVVIIGETMSQSRGYQLPKQSRCCVGGALGTMLMCLVCCTAMGAGGAYLVYWLIQSFFDSLGEAACSQSQLLEASQSPAPAPPNGAPLRCPADPSGVPNPPNGTGVFFRVPVETNKRCGCCAWRGSTCCANGCMTKPEFTTRVGPSPDDECNAALGLMNCAMCAADAAQYTVFRTVADRGVTALTVRVCPSRCAHILNACGDASSTFALEDGDNRTVREIFGSNATEFCQRALQAEVAHADDGKCYNGAARARPGMALAAAAVLWTVLGAASGRA